MKFLDSILFYLGVGLFLIAIFETMVLGIGSAYGIFMLSLVLFFLYGYRKNKRADKK